MNAHTRFLPFPAATLLVAALFSLAACTEAASSSSDDDTGPGPGPGPGPAVTVAVVSAASSLPFDLSDDAATFTARVQVRDAFGGTPSASLTYDGQTYTTDASGLLTVPNVRVRNVAGLRIVAPGFLSRSVQLQYASAGREPLRVILERAGASVQFDAAAGGAIAHGPVSITFPAGGIVDASGQAYNGPVNVAAKGVDAIEELLDVSLTGEVTLKDGFDPARIPQGYGVATDAAGKLISMLPEATFQAELTDASGGALNLASGQTAAVALRLSSNTSRKAGDQMPLFHFSESEQRWKAEGTCTVAAGDDGALSCAGNVSHFSSWAAGSDAEGGPLACANLSFLFHYTETYPKEISFEGRTYTTPAALSVRPVMKAFGTEFLPSAVNADGTSFLSNFNTGGVRVRFVAYRLEAGRLVADTMSYVFAEGSEQGGQDLMLSRTGGATATNLDASQSASENPFDCGRTILRVELDQATVDSTAADGTTIDPKQPIPNTDPCANVTCEANERCDSLTARCVEVPSCTDGEKNGLEPDVDCGGSCTDRCAVGRSCSVAGDCASASCVDGVCAPSCAGVTCDAGQSCDPATGACVANPTCEDDTKNGSETDVDCGGSCESNCADGLACVVDGDCASGSCVELVCAASVSCDDGVKNGSETAVDCGGSCPNDCADGLACLVDGDCVSGSCVELVCALPCSSVLFDGQAGSQIAAPHVAAYDPAGAFTIEAWVRPGSAPITNFVVIAAHADASTYQSYSLLLLEGRIAGFGISDGVDAYPAASDTAPLEVDTWTHLAGVFDQTEVRLYRNGALVGSAPAAFSRTVPITQPFTIGNDGPANATFGFTGRVDEVRLSSVARYTAAFTPATRFTPDADTVALYHLDAPAPGSTVAPDSSATANDGTLSGGASYAPICP